MSRLITHRRFACFALATVCAVLLAPVTGAQKPPRSTTIPTIAEFTGAGILDDGLGPYVDKQSGVSSYRVSGSGSTNGWAFDLAASKSKTPRRMTYDLSNPFSGPSQGVIVLNDTHGQIYDLSDMEAGEVRNVRAAFHLIINRVDHVLRFGQSAGDGSSPLTVTRLSQGVFDVRTGAQGDLARFLRGNGPGEVLIGIYHVPIVLELTNQ